MKDLLKKAVLFGVGAGSITKDKAESFVKELEKSGYFDEKEGKKLVEYLIKQSMYAEKQIVASVEEHVKKAIDMMPLATKQDLKDLEKKLKKKK